MSNSGTKINYSLRPAKNIERKMLRDLFGRLSSIYPMKSYRYIGFGAKYFADFSLFHKTLHIEDMISLEQDRHNQERYEFNKPYNSIKMLFGKASDVLPKINLAEKPTLVWLDYDDEFNPGILHDVSIILKKLISGSSVVVSYNATPYTIAALKRDYPDLSEGHYLKKLKDLVGKDWLVSSSDDMTGMGKVSVFSTYLKRCLDRWIDKKIEERNLKEKKELQLKKYQFAYFDYADGAKMSTVGYVFLNDLDLKKMGMCNFSEFDFYRNGDESYTIPTPNLTLKEISRLLAMFPLDGEVLDCPKWDRGIYNPKDVEDLHRVYKYFPSFSEVEG